MTSTPSPLPPLHRLRQLLTYDPVTGRLCRAMPVNRSVMVDNKRYSAARLCYSLGHQVQLSPDQRVIHLNGDKRDTRLANLALDDNPMPDNPKPDTDDIDTTLQLYGALWG